MKTIFICLSYSGMIPEETDLTKLEEEIRNQFEMEDIVVDIEENDLQSFQCNDIIVTENNLEIRYS